MKHNDSIQKTRNLPLSGLMTGLMSSLLALLAGCAATPPAPDIRSAPEPASVTAGTTAVTTTAPAIIVYPPPESGATGTGSKGADKAGNAAEPVPSAERAASSKALLYPGTGVFVNPRGPSAPRPASGGEVMLNFEGADLREVVKSILGDILKETYAIDPRVQGLINLHTSSPLARSALLPTLESLLRMNGAAIIREDGSYKIVPAATAARGSVSPQLRSGSLQEGYSVQIVPLKFIATKDMIKILEPFVTDATAIRADEVRNLLILAGTARELQHMLETIDMFDVDWLAGMSVGLFPLQNIDAKAAFADLDKIFGDKAKSPLTGLVKLVPMERLNAILVITSQPKYLDQAKTWIERMDRSGSASGSSRLFVYPVQNGNAEKLAQLLNEVFGGASAQKTTPAATLAPGLNPAELKSPEPAVNLGIPTQISAQNSTQNTPPGSAPALTQPGTAGALGESSGLPQNIRVIADKSNNALMILASPSDYEKIESALRKLDVAARQVLIDVTIAEVSLTGDFQYGVEWSFRNGDQRTGRLGNPSASTNAVNAGFSYLWNKASVPGGVGAALNLLQNDSRVRILSSPHLMVVDNQTAKINVGDRVPTTTQSQSIVGSTTGIINSIQYVDTGVILSVTPHINAGGLVTMEINQEVSFPKGATTSLTPTISKRTLQSTVVVKTGETMVLGGLIRDNNSDGSSGLPFLSTIPVIGGLFGTQRVSSERTELVLFITPRVVTDSQQAREVTEEFRKKITGLGDLLEKAGKSVEIPKTLDKQLK